MRAFGWRADRKAIGRLWHCAECGRLCIAQVVGNPGGDFTATANGVLASLQCHSPEAGWRTWALYDLLTQVPADYALKGQPQLMNVYLQLAFQLGQSLDTITVEQWSVANVQLRGAYLNEWYRSKNGALEPTLRYAPEETEAQRPPGPAPDGAARRSAILGRSGAAAGRQAAAARDTFCRHHLGMSRKQQDHTGSELQPDAPAGISIGDRRAHAMSLMMSLRETYRSQRLKSPLGGAARRVSACADITPCPRRRTLRRRRKAANSFAVTTDRMCASVPCH